MNDNNTTQFSEYVSRRMSESFNLFGREVEGVVWLWILIPILVVAIFYVVWMYVRDGRSIGWIWAAFLGLLRLSVYAILAAVFLLPAVQHWEESQTRSKVVLGFDVSRSMPETRDDLPTEAIPYEKMPTRQDRVLEMLADPKAAFLKRLIDRNPVTAYRWGLGVDEEFLVLRENRVWNRRDWEEWTRATNDTEKPPGADLAGYDWKAWLAPKFTDEVAEGLREDERKAILERRERLRRLFAGTNVGESALGVVTREVNNMVQGVILFTDGRSTQSAPAAFKDLADRARRAKIPVFVIGVGEDRPPVRIDIADARGPDEARPDDPFPINVDVTGEGLAGREVTVYLDIFKPGATPGKDPPAHQVEKRVAFKPGQPPRAQAEFIIKPEEYGEIPTEAPEDKPEEKPAAKPGDKPTGKPTKPQLTAGKWAFVARVPRDRAEIFAGKEHVRPPLTVDVVKRRTRVLVVTSVASREYQFVRTQLARESDKKRVELSIYLQGLPGIERRSGVVQDVPPERMLTRFPDRLDLESKGEEDAIYNLANYDVILAFDPNWTELSREQAAMLEQWVGQQGGGLIVVAGPVHTLELARPTATGVKPGAGENAHLKPILDIYPVTLKDARLEKERNTSEPVRLQFPGADLEMEFLKLDEDENSRNPVDAWNEFFFGPKGDGARPVRGFFNFYPVQKTKEGCVTVATFSDPLVQDAAGRMAPYLVIQPRYGRGRTVWLGSGETWRLRQYREVWHERFWTKLVRYAAAGSVGGQSTRRIIPNVGRTFPAGRHVEVEAQMLARDLKPLPNTARPKLSLTLPPGVLDKDIPLEYEMSPKEGQGEWEGWFRGRFLVKTPGKYGIKLRLPDSNEAADASIEVIEVDPELDNTRPDFGAIFDLASDVDEVLERLDPAQKQELLGTLARFQRGGDRSAANAADRDRPRLIFDLKTATIIPDLMLTRTNVVRNRGAVQDLWDMGLPLSTVLMWCGAFCGAVALLLLIGALVSMSAGRGATGLLIGVAAMAVLALVGLGFGLYTQASSELSMSIVLGLVVGLLSVEWLTRKLLRLA